MKLAAPVFPYPLDAFLNLATEIFYSDKTVKGFPGYLYLDTDQHPLDHISNRDIAKLHELILELDKIVFKLKPDAEVHTELKSILAEIKYDIEGLQDLVEQQAGLIYQLTPSSALKGIVNSVLDSMSVDDTLPMLKAKK